MNKPVTWDVVLTTKKMPACPFQEACFLVKFFIHIPNFK